MHVEKKQPTSTQVVLTISSTDVELTPIKNEVVAKLSKDIKIAGFRPGKAPLQVAEKQLDANLLSSEVVNEAINQFYIKAIDTEGLNPLTQPQITVQKFAPYTELVFEAGFDVIGKVKLGTYKKLGEKLPKVEVKDEDVENVLKSLRVQQSTKTDVERAAKKDDQVWIDFSGKNAKGEPVQGADGKDYPIILGSKTFIPGFEENVEGLSAGEEKTFTIPFPKDYGVKALAGRKVTFTVKVNKVQEVTLPEADDELAKSVGPFKSISELKENIKTNVEQEKLSGVTREYENALLEKLLASSSVEIPESVIKQQVVYELDEFKRSLTYRGQTYKEFLEGEGQTEEEYEASTLRPRAEKAVKISILLSEVAKAEKLQLEEGELEAQIAALKGQYQDPAMQAELAKPESQRDIANRMLTQKTIDKIKELQ